MRGWPRSLAGRLILLLVGALVAAQAIGILFFVEDRHETARFFVREQTLGRTASVVRLLDAVPADLQTEIVRTASSSRSPFWISEDAAVATAEAAPGDHPVAQRLAALIGDERALRVRVADEARPFAWWRHRTLESRAPRRERLRDEDGDEDDDDGRFERRHRHWHDRRHARPVAYMISVPLARGGWLNAEMRDYSSPGPAWRVLAPLGLAIAAVILVVVVVVRRITRPMQRLAVAADAFGRGEAGDPLPEEGPEELRRTINAFNRMRDRLRRFVEDRTRMLAAISHDLRTPITTLRLRAEFIEDEETRTRILATLEEMQRMTEAALAFAREEAAQEDTRTVDLRALAGSLCDDLADIGQDVSFEDGPALPWPCRPVALRRALRNLVENAVRYGERARVRVVRPARGGVAIEVDDDGPGIAEGEMETVFQPFVRLERSRSSETGGIGLGLAIARSIARSHGGDITLTNREGGGLRAVLYLPAAG